MVRGNPIFALGGTPFAFKLAITGSSDTVNVGNQITYTITITNHGPSASSNIRGGFAGRLRLPTCRARMPHW